MSRGLVLLVLAMLAAAGLFALARPSDGNDALDAETIHSEALPETTTSTTTTALVDDGAQASTSATANDDGNAAVSTTTEAESESETLIERDADYRWLRVDPTALRLVWRSDDDRPYGQLQAGRAAIERGGEQVLVITNAGIYDPGLIPAGLHIENGEQLVALNQNQGSGNFYLQPNGVFWIAGGEAAIETTQTFAANHQTNDDGHGIDLAVQSGPMLVIDGQANEKFSPDASSTHVRNAIAVDAQGQVLLVISRRRVNLRSIADRCLELGAVQALYLDGSLSRLEAVVAGRPIFPNIPVAAMLAVVDVEEG